MALTLNNFCGFETGGLEELYAVTGAPAAVESPKRTGDYSFQCGISDSGDLQMLAHGSDGGGKYIIGMGLRAPAGSSTATVFQARDSTGTCWYLTYNQSTQQLSLYDAADGLIGSVAYIWSAVWYFIEVVWDHSNSGSIDLYLDGGSSPSISGSSKDLSAGGSIDATAVYRLLPVVSTATRWDDFYCMSGAASVSDRLGDCEVFRYQANTASATPDTGDDLDYGDPTLYWQEVGTTPGDADEIGYAAYPLTGAVYTDDVASGKHYRHGPHGDGNIDGTIRGGKWLHQLRGVGAGNYYKRYGNDGDGLTDEVVALTTAYANYITVSELATVVPLATEHFAIGFKNIDQKKDLRCKGMWAFILHVPSAGGQAHEGSASLSGAGTLSCEAVAALTGAASPSGEGTVIASGQAGRLAQASLSGEGTLTASGQVSAVQEGSASLAGEGTASATGIVDRGGGASLSGEGILTASASAGARAKASLSGEGTVAAAAIVAAVASVSLSGEGTLSAAGTLQVAGAASLSGEGTLSASSVRECTAGAALSGEGSLSAVGIVQAVGVASLAGEGTLTADGQITGKIEGEASLSGEGTLSAAGVVQAVGAATISGEGTLIASGQIGGAVEGAASLVGTGGLSASGALRSVSAASLTGEGTVVVGAVRGRHGAAAVSGEGTLSAGGAVGAAGSAELSGDGTLTASGLRGRTAGVSLSGQGSLAATGIVRLAAAASISGEGVLTVKSAVLFGAAAILSGQGSLTADGRITVPGEARYGEATLSGEGTLVAGGIVFAILFVDLAASYKPVLALAASYKPRLALAASYEPMLLFAASYRPVISLAASYEPIIELEALLA